MRKLFIPTLLLLIITAFIYPEIGSTHTSMEPVREAVLNVGADFDAVEVNGFSLINRRFMKYGEMTDTLIGLAEYIGADAGQYTLSGKDEEEYRQVTLQGRKDGNQMVLSLQSYKLPSGEESYLITNFYNEDENTDIDSIYEKADDCFKRLNVDKPQISVIITGHYDGQLAEKDMGQIMSSIMSYLDASYHKNEMYDNLLTATGYSKKISEYIQLGSEKINIDLAMRYSEGDGKTYLWLGSPVITTDY